MAIEIYEASPRALGMITDDARASALPATFEKTHHRVKYPFQCMELGQCFTVPLATGNETSLRVSATRYGKDNGKRFAVLKHVDLDCVEVARIG